MSLDIKAALYGTTRRMHAVQRYSSLPVVRPENVAEHSWQIALLSYLIGLDQTAQGRQPNMSILLERAIMHDISESLSGDIIRSFKHSSTEIKNAIDNADDLNMVKLMKELTGTNEWESTMVGVGVYYAWRDAKRGFEGEIVAFADLLCVVSYCQEEHALGSRKLDRVLRHLYEHTIIPFSEEHSWCLQYVQDLFPTGKWCNPYYEGNLMIGSSQK